MAGIQQRLLAFRGKLKQRELPLVVRAAIEALNLKLYACMPHATNSGECFLKTQVQKEGKIRSDFRGEPWYDFIGPS